MRAILCTRGGYGSVHLLDRLGRLPLRDNPKWIIGYSDITAIHALMLSKGIRSIHSPMCRHLATTSGRDDDSLRLFSILQGHHPTLTFGPSPLNHTGTASGLLVGGNLAVMSSLISTPFDMTVHPGAILFIEDIAEPIYKVERMLHTLRLNGTLSRIAALIVGQFTKYTPSPDHPSMEEMIAEFVAPYQFPVAFSAPIGHVGHNSPLLIGSTVTLTVSDEAVTLQTKI